MDSRDDTRVPPSGSQFYEASFIQSASSPASRLMVRVDAFGDAPFGDPDGVVWSPLGNALPAAGDRCLVAESDDGSWWVLSWWSGTQATVSTVVTRTSGSGTATWAGGTSSSPVTVPHGLGVVPTYANASPKTGAAGYDVTAADATNLTIVGFTTAQTVFTGSLGFYWTAFR